MSTTRKLRRARRQVNLRGARCSHPKCDLKARTKHECLTCERTGKDTHTVFGCRGHAEWAQQRIRRHALVAHPVNLVRAVGRQLAGDDVLE